MIERKDKMGRSKQNKGGNKGGEKYRKETKEERRERLRQQEEARDKCFRLLPYAGGATVIFFLIFGMWVRSVPPKPMNLVNYDSLKEQVQDFLNVDVKSEDPLVKETDEKPMEIPEDETVEEAAATTEETIEL